MITQLRIFEGKGFDPHNNLALEKHLMDITQPGECLLYLWQNQNTVVIGRNQNAWLECRTSLLEEEGGIVVSAVFRLTLHDSNEIKAKMKK